jgi:CBS domain-containing protein
MSQSDRRKGIQMKSVSDVMTHVVRTAHTTEVVGPLRDLMFDERLHAVPVLDPHGSLVGIVTSSDLVEEWAPEQGVTTVMSSPVHTVPAGATVAEAAQLMLDHLIHHLPVIHHGELVGIASSFDLLRALNADVAAGVPPAGPGRRGHPGDHIVIRAHGVGRRDRRAIIVEARGEGDTAPFVVRWLDDPHAEPHDVLFFPGADADIEPASASATVAVP